MYIVTSQVLVKYCIHVGVSEPSHELGLSIKILLAGYWVNKLGCALTTDHEK